MFYEPQTLIVVYKDEMLVNQIKKLIETKDDSETEAIGTKDKSINVVSWTEKTWLTNKKAGNINSKILFLGDIKGVDKLKPVIDEKFNEHGVKYGWAGNQAVVYAVPEEIKSIDNYRLFYAEMNFLPIPKSVKEAIQPKDIETKQNDEDLIVINDESKEFEQAQPENFFKKSKQFLKRIGNTFEDIGDKASVFIEENFKNKKIMEQQMLFYGVIKLYNDGLELFMNS